MNRLQAFSATWTLAAIASTAQAQPLRIGGFNAARGGLLSISSGQWLQTLRTAILEGFPGVELTGSGSLSEAFLGSIDVLVIASVTGGSTAIVPLSAGEQATLRLFVEAGGGAVIFVDNADFALANESCLAPFGVVVTGYDGGPATVAAPADSPVSNGPFGLVSSFEPAYAGWFSDLGPSAISLATFDLTGEPALAVIESGRIAAGSGFVVLFSDTSMIFDKIINTTNQTIVLNAIAAAAGPPPPPPCPADYNHDGVLNSQDFFNYVACFFNPEVCVPNAADFNADGTTNSQDFFDFLAEFFEGCP